MHRFKGLEYQRMIIAGVSDGLVPAQHDQPATATPTRSATSGNAQRDRSLLFVAATRARDELAVFWHGTPSPFLTSRLRTASATVNTDPGMRDAVGQHRTT